MRQQKRSATSITQLPLWECFFMSNTPLRHGNDVVELDLQQRVLRHTKNTLARLPATHRNSKCYRSNSMFWDLCRRFWRFFVAFFGGIRTPGPLALRVPSEVCSSGHWQPKRELLSSRGASLRKRNYLMLRLRGFSTSRTVASRCANASLIFIFQN